MHSKTNSPPKKTGKNGTNSKKTTTINIFKKRKSLNDKFENIKNKTKIQKNKTNNKQSK